jgi:putative toxin-antitoxin system antitoxin component (TIGR02293 family)
MHAAIWWYIFHQMEEFMPTIKRPGRKATGRKTTHAVAESAVRYIAKPRAGSASAFAAARDAGMFSELVGNAPSGGASAVEAIRAGFPAALLKSASRYFGVTDARMQTIVHVPASTAARLEKAASRIDAAASERLYRMGMVTRIAIELFGEQALAIAWMRETNHALGDVAPLDLMDTEPGAGAVRQVLNAIATGGVA